MVVFGTKGRRKRMKSGKGQREDEKVQAMMRGRSSHRGKIRSRLFEGDECDLFSGEWVPDPDGPYYTNETCYAIQEHQNCLKFGRPDRGYLKWRWKPDECELPLFDPQQFLQLVRGLSLAFVGDSVGRNHMQSLICLLSSVSWLTCLHSLILLFWGAMTIYHVSRLQVQWTCRSQGTKTNGTSTESTTSTLPCSGLPTW